MITINKIRKIVEEIGSDIPITVEGKKDKIVLNKIGFEKVFDISGNSLNEFVEKIKSNNFNTIVILTDFDEEGEIKSFHLEKLFNHLKIKTDSFARRRFKSFGIHKIEELKSFTKIMEDDYYGKTCSIYDKISDRSRVHDRRYRGKARCNRIDIRTD
jgi:5S rRNA maturation endonuclease (ribonuclease M5)